MLSFPMARILVVVNKFWECDAVMAALLNETVRAAGCGWPNEVHQPRLRGVGWPVIPRAVYQLKKCSVEVWCVSDFLEHSDSTLQSSTEEKAKQLVNLFNRGPMDLLIAVGTAGFPSADINNNGCVVVGTHVFIHDGHPADNPNKLSAWRSNLFDQVIDSTLSEKRFADLTNFDATVLTKSLVKPPVSPTSSPSPILIDYAFVSLGTVNVTDYHDYKRTDPEALAKFDTVANGLRAGSSETTHGLLRVMGTSNFVFVSGITDRIGVFDDEVTVGQNFAASYNAGIVVSGLILNLDSIF